MAGVLITLGFFIFIAYVIKTWLHRPERGKHGEKVNNVDAGASSAADADRLRN
jgi:hypothetical protein